MIQQRLGTDLTATASSISASATRTAGANRTFDTGNLTDGDKDTYWATNDGEHTATINVEWAETQTLHYVMLMEYIRLGQRIRKFSIETSLDGVSWKKCAATTTTVGYKRIVPLNNSTTTYGGVDARYLRISIEDSRSCPTLHTLSVY